jgi:hypothetical protein
MSNDARVRVALAVIGACTTAVAFYALLRVAQFYLFPEPNPALVIWSAHAGYFWRAWTVSYVGGLVGFFAYAASAADPARVARLATRAVIAAGVLIAAQGLLVP